MITYEVTPTGLDGWQVTAIGPGWESTIVGDFRSQAAAEAFAATMRRVDAKAPLDVRGGGAD